MRDLCFILTFIFALTACNKNDSTTNENQADTLTKNETLNNQVQASKRLTFRNVDEIIAYAKSSAWAEFKEDSSTSLVLHFDLDYKDTLAVSYSPECWLMFPYKIENEKFIVYWDVLVDTKYDFDIVKAINKIDNKFTGKPFIILELINDTTLKATYPIPELIREINSSSKVRTFFPEKFVFAQNGYL